ncbi:MAG: aminoacetone oxidase family FAD-binding enzyme, partial [Clostridia bacterium]|nr:aminoacetone oxidase family FAD-binding enzyme [Clostridia bacterium]
MRISLLIVGAGPAGMTAAVNCSSPETRVVVADVNEKTGRKLRITGKGRCNLTNDCDVREFLTHVTKNEKFLLSSLSRFAPRDTMDYFESLGVPLKTERGRRVFPVSDRASDIASALEKDVKKHGAVFVRDRILSLERTEASGEGPLWLARGLHDTYEADAVLLATGGLSYPATGSTGDGYRLAESLGHAVTPLIPSLVPIVTSEDVSSLTGLSLRNVRLSLFNEKGKTLYSEIGEMLFIPDGISGPLALSASAHLRALEQEKYRLEIDWKPGLDEEALDRRLLRDFSEKGAKDFINSLSGLLPRSAIPY